MRKRLLALLLAVMVVASCLTIGAAATLSNDWTTWNQRYTGLTGEWYQKDGGTNAVVAGACRLYAQAKLLAESGVLDDSRDTADTYVLWMDNNGYIAGRSGGEYYVGETSKCNGTGGGMIAYAAEKGVTISRVKSGENISSLSLDEQKNLIMNYLKQGYYIILDSPAPHQAYIMRGRSLQENTPYVSNSGSGVTPTSMTYEYNGTVSSSGTSAKFTNIYVYSVSGTPTDPTPTKPAAPSASVVTINYAAETISYDSSKYEVSATNFGSVIANGGSISGVIDGVATNIYVRVKSQGNTPASDATAVKIPGRVSPMYMNMVDYVNEVFNTDADNQYSLNGTTWIDCTGKTPLSVAAGNEIIYIREAATSSAFASNSATITVPTRGAAPTGIEKTDETVDQRNDGTITGVTNAMQYRVSGGTWADCPEDGTITGLADATYEVRYKSTTSALASNPATVVIAQGVPQTFTLGVEAPEFDDVVYNYVQPEAEALVITSSGNTDSTISSVTSDSKNFVIGTGSTTVPYGQSVSDWTVQPVAGLEAGTYTATITVTYNNGATATDTVSFTVDKAPQAAPAAPEIAKRDYTSITLKALAPNANGAVAQYRIDGGEWQTSPVFEDLRAGHTYTFEQRYAAVGSYYASPASKSAKFQTQAYNVPDTYDIDLIVSDGGEAKTNLSNASAGTTITVTATPDEGYKLDYITVDGERISGTSFKMPAHDVTVRVYFTDGTSTLPFTDVRPNQWFYDAISYVYTNGMMEGDSATTFNPDGQMTRAMFWAVLGRIDGANITGANWIDTARNWAMSKGVSDGTDPNGLVTREMMVTMLWRYVGEPASDYSLSAYTDASSVSDWAAEAMAWAVENGVISGVSATTLAPQGTATRAQCAMIFMRYDADIA